MTTLPLTRRSLLVGLTTLGLSALVGCDSRPTQPSGWTDGVPEAPTRRSKVTAVCDMAQMMPRPVPSRDGSLVLTYARWMEVAGRSGALLWDTATGRLLPDSLSGARSEVTRFRHDNSLVGAVGAAVVHSDPASGTARHFGTGHALFEPPCGGVSAITSVVCSPIGKYVATGGDDGYVGIFDWQTAHRLTWVRIAEGYAMVHGFSLDKLVVSLDDATLLLKMDGTEAFRFDGTPHRPLVAEDTLLVANPDGGWDRIDPATGRQTAHLPSEVRSWDTLTPDGATLFTSPNDHVGASLEPRPFQITDVATGTTREVSLTILTGGTVLLPDGRLLAATDEGISVFDSTTGEPQGTFATS